jgi:hypothetical protein
MNHDRNSFKDGRSGSQDQPDVRKLFYTVLPFGAF